jgi:hypothetical protein
LLNVLQLPFVIVGFAVALGVLLRWAVPSVCGSLAGARGL